MQGSNWVTLVYVVLAGGVTLLGAHFARKSERRWIAALAEQLGAKASGRTLKGDRKGLPFTITFAPQSDSPRWQVRIAAGRSPPLLARRQGSLDARVAKLGLETEAKHPDPEQCERLWLGAPDAAAATAFLADPNVARALAAVWPYSENAEDGEVSWIQLGDGLHALIDVSKVSEATFDERLEALLDRLISLSAAVSTAPTVPTEAAPLALPLGHDRLRREMVVVSIAMSVVSVAAVVLGGLMKVSMSVDLRLMGGLAAVGAGAALVHVWMARGTPFLRPRLWRIATFATAGAVLGFLAPVMNALPGEPAHTQSARVVALEPADVPLFDLWSLELEGVGTFVVPASDAVGLEQGVQVNAEVQSGVLGGPRLLAISRAD